MGLRKAYVRQHATNTRPEIRLGIRRNMSYPLPMSTVLELKQAVQELPRDQYGEFRQWLNDYELKLKKTAEENQEPLSKEWLDELDKRTARLDVGETQLHPHEEVHKDVQNLLQSFER